MLHHHDLLKKGWINVLFVCELLRIFRNQLLQLLDLLLLEKNGFLFSDGCILLLVDYNLLLLLPIGHLLARLLVTGAWTGLGRTAGNSNLLFDLLLWSNHLLLLYLLLSLCCQLLLLRVECLSFSFLLRGDESLLLSHLQRFFLLKFRLTVVLHFDLITLLVDRAFHF